LNPFRYLQTEVFEQYRPYFLLVLHVFPYLVLSVFHVFLRYRPVLHAQLGLSVIYVFQPYPELFHVFVAVLLMGCHPQFLVSTATTHTLSVCVVILVAITCFVQPLMLYLWLERGSGNANYYYFQCLASTGMVSILMVQFYFGVVTRDAVVRRIQRLVAMEEEEEEKKKE
jgi:phosphatidylinositol glycan class U